MADNSNEDINGSPDSSKDSGLDKSIVGKLVSGIISNTPLSKWFGKSPIGRSVVRPREEDDEDFSFISQQPPVKRVKSSFDYNNCSAHVYESPVTLHNTSNNVNNVSTKVFFPEPVAGPSGISSRRLLKRHSSASTNSVSNVFEDEELVNGNNDNESDSEASTSGYASVLKPATKLVISEDGLDITDVSRNRSNRMNMTTPKSRSLFTSNERSLFSERSLNPQGNSSLSSRRPAFNASTFGSPNFVDRTISTRRIYSSPFYSGNTIYGGASAYSRLRKSSEERNSVQIKPVNQKSNSDENVTLSKTARRILSTLEQYSTPISDAKKIPIAPKRHGILSKYVGATPYMVRNKRASNTELQVPSVPDLLKMKQKERLQNSTETVRQIAAKSSSSLNKDAYKLRTQDDNKQRHTNKMKSNITSVRQRNEPLETVPEVTLPKVSLPITTLPKFDFVMAPPQSSDRTSEPALADEKVVDQKTKKTSKAEQPSYVFAKPDIISECSKTITGINSFKFSEPISRKPTTFKMPEKQLPVLKVRNNGENVKKTDNRLVAGSVMDILGKTTSKSREMWECATCLVKNEHDKTKCVACEEPKEKETETTKRSGFGSQFKLSSDKWECSTCLVRNNNSDNNCVACTTPRPAQKQSLPVSGFGDKFKPAESTWECNTCLIRNKSDLQKCAACETPRVSKPIKDIFKPASDTWECGTCLIRNKNEFAKCAACETPRNGSKLTPSISFGNKFKPPSETWECSVCMIRNKNEFSKCAACETLKPGEKVVATPVLSFNFGVTPLDWECKTCMIRNKQELEKCAACEMPKDNTPSFSTSFKLKGSEWECSSCLVKNKSTADACVCCGVKKRGPVINSEKLSEFSEKKPMSSFNFGIDKSSPGPFNFGVPSLTSETSSTPGLLFGSPPKTVASTSSFIFGVNAQENKTETVVTSGQNVTPKINTNPLLKSSEKLPEKAKPASAGFKFGLDNSKVNQPLSSSTEMVTPTVSTSSKPVFQFKPNAALNGDVNKAGSMLLNKSTELNSSTTSIPTFKFEAQPLQTTPSSTSQPTATLKFSESEPSPPPAKRSFTESSEANVNNGFSSTTKFPALATTNFSFGTAENKSSFGATEATPFGATEAKKALASSESKIPPPIFGSADNKPSFGYTETKPVFGGSENTSAPFVASDSKPALPAFGSGEKKSFFGNATENKSVFGSVDNKSVFGSTDSTPSFGNANIFQFGQPEKPPVSPAAPVFNFASTTNSAMNPGFGGSNPAFGQSNPNTGFNMMGASTQPPRFAASNPTPSRAFNFTSTSVPNSGFNFGSTAKAEAPANVFGSSGAKNGTFNFGTNSNNTNQKAVFTFGSAQPNPQASFPTNTQPPLNFGSSSVQAAASTVNPGTFNFSGAPPSFNFTEGNAVASQPQRKIRKALRRTHR